MDQQPLHYGTQYLADFTQSPFLPEDTSNASSPSPIMWPPTDQFAVNPEHYMYEGLSNTALMQPGYPPPADLPVVEFTDLTAPYEEDRRRRKSQVKDKQAISSMHMRRRAQNRASQRAFRERKERHAQELQRQLDELQEKHQALQESYDELGGVNKKLLTELQHLKTRISAVHASQVQLERSGEEEDQSEAYPAQADFRPQR